MILSLFKIIGVCFLSSTIAVGSVNNDPTAKVERNKPINNAIVGNDTITILSDDISNGDFLDFTFSNFDENVSPEIRYKQTYLTNASRISNINRVVWNGNVLSFYSSNSKIYTVNLHASGTQVPIMLADTSSVNPNLTTLYSITFKPATYDDDVHKYLDFYNALSTYIQGPTNQVETLTTFVFEENFNYNAPYSFDIESGIIPYAPFVGNGSDASVEKVYTFPFFQSGYDEYDVWDTIKLVYKNAYHIYYKVGDDISYVDTTGYIYFHHMEFYNSLTDSSELVFYRPSELQIIHTSNVVPDEYREIVSQYGFWWYDGYKHLVFEGDLSNDELRNLTQFNSSGIGDVSNHLADSFGLINSAFTGISGLMNYYLFPGISIGVLILIPFFITLILFVIRLFKR